MTGNYWNYQNRGITLDEHIRTSEMSKQEIKTVNLGELENKISAAKRELERLEKTYHISKGR